MTVQAEPFLDHEDVCGTGDREQFSDTLDDRPNQNAQQIHEVRFFEAWGFEWPHPRTATDVLDGKGSLRAEVSAACFDFERF